MPVDECVFRVSDEAVSLPRQMPLFDRRLPGVVGSATAGFAVDGAY